jgi:putative flavoprotein involved in K+ transport
MTERPEVIVVGGGQTGLVAGYFLRRAGIPFLILDAADSAGDSWRNRWDSLRLFTIAPYCSLPGVRFPARFGYFPTKDEMADYLDDYARRQDFPTRYNTRVTSIEGTRNGQYVVRSTGGDYEVPYVIVCTGAYLDEFIPDFPGRLDDEVFQVHTGSYRNPSQIPGRRVVVVGAANSGAQIAVDLAATHDVYLSQGSPLPAVPCKFLGVGLHYWGDKFGLIRKPLLGERDRLHRKTILIGKSLKKLAQKHGLTLVGRTVDVGGRIVTFDDGPPVATDAVVWATGFRPRYDWIDLPVVGADGRIVQQRGVTLSPGLYFLGIQCQYSYGSALIWWVKEDAEYVIGHLANLRRERTREPDLATL